MRNGRHAGVLLATATAVVSGFAIFFNGYGVRAWSGVADATTYTTLKNLMAALILLVVAGIATRRRSSEAVTRPATTRQWIGLAAVSVIGGSIPFVLFFEGLSRASSTQAAFLHKTLVIWVAILAIHFLGERIGALHLAAIGLLVAGQVLLVGGIGDLSFGVGEIMIFGATVLWSVEVIIAKRLLGGVSSLTIGVSRMAGGTILLMGYGAARGAFVFSGVTAEHLMWILVTGILLAAYVSTWFAALARAKAIDVTAVLVGGAVITALLRLGVQGTALPSLTGLGLVTAGAAVAAAAEARRPATAS
ncbi:MAG: DMT family transporter [Acidimicrobiia bacterium]